MAEFDEREEELSSLSAIFPELSIDPKDPFSASLELAVTPTQPLLIRFIPSKSRETRPMTFHLGIDAKSETKSIAYVERDHELTHLPPLKLELSLSDQYPSSSPPKVRLSTQYKWLPKAKLTELENDVRNLWEEYGQCQILFAYIDHIQSAAERGFDLDQTADGCLVLPVTMEDRLVTFNLDTKQTVFNSGTYDCGICIEPKKGSACYQLRRCGHIFCRQCSQDFYNNAITEGDIAGVKCLAPDCGKEGGSGNTQRRKRKAPRSVQPKELLALGIEESMVRRYVELKRKKKMEADKNTIYCPRQWCQGTARRKEFPPLPADLSAYEMEPSSDEESDKQADQQKSATNGTTASKETKVPNTADRLAICEKCQYAFCRICYTGWHGEFARCHPRDPNELSAEDKASYDWILTHTSPCPSCNSPTQKTMGCNHMKCFQCNTHFCYLCGAWLDPQMPYTHFNTRGTECYQRLFELEEGDEGQGPADGRGFAGMRRWEQMALEIAREAEAEEAAAAAQAEEDARAVREARALDDTPQANHPANEMAVEDIMGMEDIIAFLQLENDAAPVPPPVPDAQAGGRRRRNPYPAYARGGGDAVRNHERNRRGGIAVAAPRLGARVRPTLVEDDRQQAELQRFVEMAQRDEEDDWDSDELGDDDDRFLIR